MFGSEDALEGALAGRAAGVTPKLPVFCPSSGRGLKLPAASLGGSHGAPGCPGAADRDRICVKDAGSAGGAWGVPAPGAPLPAPLNDPNICVSEGCGEFAAGTGPPESARSRSSDGSFVKSSVNPPPEGEAWDGAAEGAGYGSGGAAGAEAGNEEAGEAIENDAVDDAAGAGAGGVEAGLAAAPPKALNEPVAERLYAPVPLSGPAGNGCSFTLTGSVAGAVPKSDVNPPADGAAAGAAGAKGAAGAAAEPAADPPNEPKTCVNEPGCDAGCALGAAGGNKGSGSHAAGGGKALSGAETLPKRSVNPPEVGPPVPNAPVAWPGAETGAAAGCAGALAAAGTLPKSSVNPPEEAGGDPAPEPNTEAAAVAGTA